MLRIRWHLQCLRTGRVGEDGPGQGRGARTRRRRIYSFGRLLVLAASKRVRPAHGRSDQIHAYRPHSQWSVGVNGTDQVSEYATRVLHPEVLSDRFEGARDADG